MNKNLWSRFPTTVTKSKSAQVVTAILSIVLLAGCCCDDVLEKAMDKGYEVLFCDADAKTTGTGKAAVDPSAIHGEGEFTTTSGHKFRLLKKQPANMRISGKVAFEMKSLSSNLEVSMAVNDRQVKFVKDEATAAELSERFKGKWQVFKPTEPIELGVVAGQNDIVEFSYELAESLPLPPSGVALPQKVEGRMGFQEEGQPWVIFAGGDPVHCSPETLLSLTAPKGQDVLQWTVQRGKELALSELFLKNATDKARKETVHVEILSSSGELVAQATVAKAGLKKFGLAKFSEIVLPTQSLEPKGYLVKLKAMNGQHVDDIRRATLSVTP